MSRQTLKKGYKTESITDTEIFSNDALSWLSQKAGIHNLTWLLAHADNGVIWGKYQDNQLHLSSSSFPDVSPELSVKLLQQLHLFGNEAELLLWRTTDGFSARLLTEQTSESEDCIAEDYLLWGTHAEQSKGIFTLLKEGKQGLCHAPPVDVGDDNEVKRLSLTVHHYIEYDADGQAYIKLSRLVRLNGGKAHD